ncbi:MAG: hypothetical protein HOH74_07650, partial [Gemmatimonadetes bacterium]|nr:hypothetical protein [Gemmatimonadota bacterium]
LQEQLDALRQLHPDAYPVSRYPAVTDDPRLDRLVRSPFEMALLGYVPFHFGDGGSSGVQTPLDAPPPLAPLDADTLKAAIRAGSPSASALHESQRRNEHHPKGTTIHDGVGIAILRTDGTPERAAAGMVYGDAPWHRHQDLLDLQVYAFGRPFISDLGYPQSWAHVGAWEGNWATHNSLWSVVEDTEPLNLPFDTPWHYLKEIAGRGRLVHTLQTDGVQILDIEARRWVFDTALMQWRDPGVRYRRLVALIETDEEGIVILDLSRIRGGHEHWRVCRGLEGLFVQPGVTPEAQSGTLAGTDVERGESEKARHPDHAGLAWMDEVSRLEAGGEPGRWTSRHDPAAHLDLHQLYISEGTTLRSARATAVMDTPERSRYDYRPLAWCRKAGDNTTTRIDLVFEPHLGHPTLSGAQSIEPASATSAAAGVLLRTAAGRELSIYWAPGNTPDDETEFQDGTRLRGALAVVDSNRPTGACTLSMVGCLGLKRGSVEVAGPGCQEVKIIALDRRECTIDVEGLAGIAAQDRVSINPMGRGHNYAVLSVEDLGGQNRRLSLDMASVHGRGRVSGTEKLGEGDSGRIELDFHLITRTANLHDTRLESEATHNWRPITNACNHDGYTTTIEVGPPPSEPATPMQAPGEADWVSLGEWVAAVDYVVGDLVRWEPVQTRHPKP